MPYIKSSTALPKDSLVLVTGANGFIASHIVDELLASGYRVRGTVRDAKKNQWLTELFDGKYGKGAFEVAEVADLAKDGSLDEATKGMFIIIISFSFNSCCCCWCLCCC